MEVGDCDDLPEMNVNKVDLSENSETPPMIRTEPDLPREINFCSHVVSTIKMECDKPAVEVPTQQVDEGACEKTGTLQVKSEDMLNNIREVDQNASPRPVPMEMTSEDIPNEIKEVDQNVTAEIVSTIKMECDEPTAEVSAHQVYEGACTTPGTLQVKSEDLLNDVKEVDQNVSPSPITMEMSSKDISNEIRAVNQDILDKSEEIINDIDETDQPTNANLGTLEEKSDNTQNEIREVDQIISTRIHTLEVKSEDIPFEIIVMEQCSSERFDTLEEELEDTPNEIKEVNQNTMDKSEEIPNVIEQSVNTKLSSLNEIEEVKSDSIDENYHTANTRIGTNAKHSISNDRSEEQLNEIEAVIPENITNDDRQSSIVINKINEVDKTDSARIPAIEEKSEEISNEIVGMGQGDSERLGTLKVKSENITDENREIEEGDSARLGAVEVNSGNIPTEVVEMDHNDSARLGTLKVKSENITDENKEIEEGDSARLGAVDANLADIPNEIVKMDQGDSARLGAVEANSGDIPNEVVEMDHGDIARLGTLKVKSENITDENREIEEGDSVRLGAVDAHLGDIPNEVVEMNQGDSARLGKLKVKSENITDENREIEEGDSARLGAVDANLEDIPNEVVEMDQGDSTSKDKRIDEDVRAIFDVLDLKSECTPMDINQLATDDNVDSDTSDESTDMQDSLGLLAESTRPVEEDEDGDDYDDCDDNEDDDQGYDEESNQTTEDSNAPSSDLEVSKRSVADPFHSDSNTEDAQDSFNKITRGNEPKETAMKLSEVEKTADEKPEIVIDSESPTEKEQNKETQGQKDVPEEEKMEVSFDGDEQPNSTVDKENNKISESVPEPIEAAEAIETKNANTAECPESAETQDEKSSQESTNDKGKGSPNRAKNLVITQTKHILNYVEIEESSSEDDVQEVKKAKTDFESSSIEEVHNSGSDKEVDNVTSVNLPKDIDIMSSSGGSNTEIVSTEGEIIISGIPKPAPPKPARLNTSEVSIKKSSASSESTLIIPEAPIQEDKQKSSFSLEVFSLDSDDEDSFVNTESTLTPKKLSAIELQKVRETNRCVNYSCPSVGKPDIQYYPAPGFVLSYFEIKRKKKRSNCVCQVCFDNVSVRMQELVNGVKDMRPLIELDIDKQSQDLVEISDSESDSDCEEPDTTNSEKLGSHNAMLIEAELENIINDTWRKYKLDERMRVTKDELSKQLKEIERESEEIDAMFAECQKMTDKLRNELYASFSEETQELPPLDIIDTSDYMHSIYSETSKPEEKSNTEPDGHLAKRFKASNSLHEYNMANKQIPIPLGFPNFDNAQTTSEDQLRVQDPTSVPLLLDDPTVERTTVDNTDITVVRLATEYPPVELPPHGDLSRPPLKIGDTVYAMRHVFGSWVKSKIIELSPKGTAPHSMQFSMFKVRFESKLKGQCVKQLAGRNIAYSQCAAVRLTIGTRVVALFQDTFNTAKRESYYSGIVAEIPNPMNKYRYMIFFDDGYAQYVPHESVRVVYETSSRIWEDVHPDSKEFVRKYLLAYPERPMVRLHAGQSIKTEWNGKWWTCRIITVDASLAQVFFEADARMEWIYRGSTRLAPLFLELQAAERHRTRGLSRFNKPAAMQNMPYVEYTRSDESEVKQIPEIQTDEKQPQEIQQVEDAKKQRAVAKKSTTAIPTNPVPQPNPVPQTQPTLDNIMSRVVYYSPKAAVKPLKMVPHTCSLRCKRTDVLPLKELRTYNPLTRPLLTGWERQILRYKGRKIVMYRTPCGRRVRDMPELHSYLQAIDSDMGVDLFDFGPSTHCLAEFVLSRCYVSKKDLSHGKENVPIPCVNYYNEMLPEFCSYNTERTPTAGVPLNLDPEFLCGCDCTDDCQDKSKCDCWKMTLAGARTIGYEGDDIGYVYKRLPEPLPTGIYECNSRCKCKKTCLNRVAQHPLQLKLQVFKTLNRGWGIRALNDIPKGAFLCVYAGNLLTDATANLDGLNEGDEYLAELDYIEVVEQMKEGYEADVQDKDNNSKESDNNSEDNDDDGDEESGNESDFRKRGRGGEEVDVDFRPACDYTPDAVAFNKHLRKRQKKKNETAGNAEKEATDKLKVKVEENQENDCITISDDEEVREPSRFTAQANMSKDDTPKHKSVRSFFGKDEACYIVDAKVQGNIGRYLNHSCQPNVFVQNVFVDTHDPRFPWVAFFALSHIRAGTELTWNYNYDIGSVPGKIMYCKCGTPNCRGRLL